MKKLNRKGILILIVILLVSISLIGCSGQSTDKQAATEKPAADKVYKWKMASIYVDPAVSQKYNSLGAGQQKFIDLVKEKTNGRVEITPFYSSTLGDNPSLFEQVRRGELEVFYGQPMSKADKRYGAWNIPFLFTNYDEIEKANAVPNGPLYKLSREWMKENKLELLAVGVANIRGFANSKHPVKVPSDVKDLKVRTYEDPAVNTFWSGLSIASPLAASELYSGLQTKAVDALEFPPTSLIGRKYYEVTKFYSDINWQWASGANIVVGDKYWNELPDDLKKAVQEAAVEAMLYQGQLERDFTEEALDELKAKGLEVYELTPQEREEWVKYARSLDGKLKEAIGEQVFGQVLKAAESVKAK